MRIRQKELRARRKRHAERVKELAKNGGVAAAPKPAAARTMRSVPAAARPERSMGDRGPRRDGDRGPRPGGDRRDDRGPRGDYRGPRDGGGGDRGPRPPRDGDRRDDRGPRPPRDGDRGPRPEQPRGEAANTNTPGEAATPAAPTNEG